MTKIEIDTVIDMITTVKNIALILKKQTVGRGSDTTVIKTRIDMIKTKIKTDTMTKPTTTVNMKEMKEVVRNLKKQTAETKTATRTTEITKPVDHLKENPQLPLVIITMR